MKKRLLRLASIAGVLLSSQGVFSFSPTNMSLPHDRYVWNSYKYACTDFCDRQDPKELRLSIGLSVEHGFQAEGRDKDNKEVGVYQIYYPTENILSLPLSAAGQNIIAAMGNANLLAGSSLASNNIAGGGIRYKMAEGAKLEETDLNLWGEVALPIEALPGQFKVGVYCPIKFMEAVGVKWEGVADPASVNTPMGMMSYQSTSSLLDLFLGGSDINTKDFCKKGVGDVNFLLSWRNHYTQVNDSLSSVGIFLQGGVSVSSSRRLDPKKVLELPFGYDNSVAIPLSAAINLNFAKNVRLSGTADLVAILDNTTRRFVRTGDAEGALFRKHEMEVCSSPGILFGFRGLGELISSCKKYSVGVMYEYVHKNEDTYSSTNSNFVAAMSAKDEKLKEKIYHNIVFRGGIDLREMSDSTLAPTLSIALKYPLRGQRVVVFRGLKFDASVNF